VTYRQVAVRDEGQERVEIPIVEHADDGIELALQLRTDGDRWRVGS
jgi:hypothetical protein